MLPVARALQKRGHDVTFATGQSVIPFIEDRGFAAIAAPNDFTEEQQIERARLPLKERGAYDIGYHFATYSPPLMLKTLQPIIDNNPPDLIIRDQLEFGGYLTAEVNDIPHATLNISAGWQVASEWLLSHVEGPLKSHRQAMKLPDGPVTQSLFRYLRLDMAPETLLPEGYFKTHTTHRFNQFKGDSDSNLAPLPPWVEAMPYDSTILITLGTVWNEADNLLHRLIASVQNEPLNVIVATGREQTSLDAESYPRHVKIVPYIAFTDLVPKLSAAIFHGGFVSLLTFLNGGLPVLVAPLAADHFMNARLVESAGVGATIDANAATETSIREALIAVMTNQSCDVLPQLKQVGICRERRTPQKRGLLPTETVRGDAPPQDYATRFGAPSVRSGQTLDRVSMIAAFLKREATRLNRPDGVKPG